MCHIAIRHINICKCCATVGKQHRRQCRVMVDGKDAQFRKQTQVEPHDTVVVQVDILQVGGSRQVESVVGQLILVHIKIDKMGLCREFQVTHLTFRYLQFLKVSIHSHGIAQQLTRTLLRTAPPLELRFLDGAIAPIHIHLVGIIHSGYTHCKVFSRGNSSCNHHFSLIGHYMTHGKTR